MKAFTYIDKGHFGFVDKPKPTLINPTDAMVRVTLSSICTSHKYPLSRIEEAYRTFENRLDHVIKTAIYPGRLK